MLAEDEGAVGFRIEDAIEGVGALVLDQLVFDDAGAMNDAIQSAVRAVDRADEVPEGLLIPHINLVVTHGRPGLSHHRQVAPYLSIL